MARRQRKDLSVFESSCHLPTCLPLSAEASHCPFNCWTSSRKAVNTNFYSLWFDPTGNRIRVYRFSSRRSIHSTTDRLKLIICWLINKVIRIGVARIFIGERGKPQITCNDVIRNFERGIWCKEIVERKIRSRGLVWQWTRILLMIEGLNQRLKNSKMSEVGDC